MKTLCLFFIISFCYCVGLAESSVNLDGKVLYTKEKSPSGTGRRSVMRFSNTGTYSKSVEINISPQGSESYYSNPDLGTYSYLNTVGADSRLRVQLKSIILPVEEIDLDFKAVDHGDLVHDASSEVLNGSFALVSPEVFSNQGLVNVSMRVVAKQGAPAIVGFVVGGSRMREFLIRAVGPSLADFGINAPAADPRYSFAPLGYLPEGQTGLAWSTFFTTVTTISREGARCGAFPLKQGSRDKADIVLLDPGAYTVSVHASSRESEGDVLLEIYEVPPF